MSPSTTSLKLLVTKWWPAIRAWLAAIMTLLLAKFGEAIFDSVTNAIGKTTLLQIVALAFLTLGYLGWVVYRHGKEKPEIEKLYFGFEFRKGPRTRDEWLPFCPKCHVVLYPEWDSFFPVKCLAGCGWESTVKPKELCEILNKSNHHDT